MFTILPALRFVICFATSFVTKNTAFINGEFPVNICKQPRERGEVRQVRLVEGSPFSQLFHCFLKNILSPAKEQHLCSRIQKLLCHSKTDAGAAACDYGPLSFQQNFFSHV